MAVPIDGVNVVQGKDGDPVVKRVPAGYKLVGNGKTYLGGTRVPGNGRRIGAGSNYQLLEAEVKDEAAQTPNKTEVEAPHTAAKGETKDTSLEKGEQPGAIDVQEANLTEATAEALDELSGQQEMTPADSEKLDATLQQAAEEQKAEAGAGETNLEPGIDAEKDAEAAADGEADVESASGSTENADTSAMAAWGKEPDVSKLVQSIMATDEDGSFATFRPDGSAFPLFGSYLVSASPEGIDPTLFEGIIPSEDLEETVKELQGVFGKYPGGGRGLLTARPATGPGIDGKETVDGYHLLPLAAFATKKAAADYARATGAKSIYDGSTETSIDVKQPEPTPAAAAPIDASDLTPVEMEVGGEPGAAGEVEQAEGEEVGDTSEFAPEGLEGSTAEATDGETLTSEESTEAPTDALEDEEEEVRTPIDMNMSMKLSAELHGSMENMLGLEHIHEFAGNRRMLDKKYGAEFVARQERNFVHSRMGMELVNQGVKVDDFAQYMAALTAKRALPMGGERFENLGLLRDIYKNLGYDDEEAFAHAFDMIRHLSDPYTQQSVLGMKYAAASIGMERALTFNQLGRNSTDNLKYLSKSQIEGLIRDPDSQDFVPAGETNLNFSPSMQAEKKAKTALVNALGMPALTATEKVALVSSLITTHTDASGFTSASVDFSRVPRTLRHMFYKVVQRAEDLGTPVSYEALSTAMADAASAMKSMPRAFFESLNEGDLEFAFSKFAQQVSALDEQLDSAVVRGMQTPLAMMAFLTWSERQKDADPEWSFLDVSDEDFNDFKDSFTTDVMGVALQGLLSASPENALMYTEKNIDSANDLVKPLAVAMMVPQIKDVSDIGLQQYRRPPRKRVDVPGGVGTGVEGGEPVGMPTRPAGMPEPSGSGLDPEVDAILNPESVGSDVGEPAEVVGEVASPEVEADEVESAERIAELNEEFADFSVDLGGGKVFKFGDDPAAASEALEEAFERNKPIVLSGPDGRTYTIDVTYGSLTLTTPMGKKVPLLPTDKAARKDVLNDIFEKLVDALTDNAYGPMVAALEDLSTAAATNVISGAPEPVEAEPAVESAAEGAAEGVTEEGVAPEATAPIELDLPVEIDPAEAEGVTPELVDEVTLDGDTAVEEAEAEPEPASLSEEDLAASNEAKAAKLADEVKARKDVIEKGIAEAKDALAGIHDKYLLDREKLIVQMGELSNKLLDSGVEFNSPEYVEKTTPFLADLKALRDKLEQDSEPYQLKIANEQQDLSMLSEALAHYQTASTKHGVQPFMWNGDYWQATPDGQIVAADAPSMVPTPLDEDLTSQFEGHVDNIVTTGQDVQEALHPDASEAELTLSEDVEDAGGGPSEDVAEAVADNVQEEAAPATPINSTADAVDAADAETTEVEGAVAPVAGEVQGAEAGVAPDDLVGETTVENLPDKMSDLMTAAGVPAGSEAHSTVMEIVNQWQQLSQQDSTQFASALSANMDVLQETFTSLMEGEGLAGEQAAALANSLLNSFSLAFFDEPWAGAELEATEAPVEPEPSDVLTEDAAVDSAFDTTVEEAVESMDDDESLGVFEGEEAGDAAGISAEDLLGVATPLEGEEAPEEGAEAAEGEAAPEGKPIWELPTEAEEAKENAPKIEQHLLESQFLADTQSFVDQLYDQYFEGVKNEAGDEFDKFELRGVFEVLLSEASVLISEQFNSDGILEGDLTDVADNLLTQLYAELGFEDVPNDTNAVYDLTSDLAELLHASASQVVEDTESGLNEGKEVGSEELPTSFAGSDSVFKLDWTPEEAEQQKAVQATQLMTNVSSYLNMVNSKFAGPLSKNPSSVEAKYAQWLGEAFEALVQGHSDLETIQAMTTQRVVDLWKALGGASFGGQNISKAAQAIQEAVSDLFNDLPIEEVEVGGAEGDADDLVLPSEGGEEAESAALVTKVLAQGVDVDDMSEEVVTQNMWGWMDSLVGDVVSMDNREAAVAGVTSVVASAWPSLVEIAADADLMAELVSSKFNVNVVPSELHELVDEIVDEISQHTETWELTDETEIDEDEQRQIASTIVNAMLKRAISAVEAASASGEAQEAPGEAGEAVEAEAPSTVITPQQVVAMGDIMTGPNQLDELAGTTLNGVTFNSVVSKIGEIPGQDEPDNPAIKEYFVGKADKTNLANFMPLLDDSNITASGVLVIEPDGSIWIRKVTGGFHGQKYGNAKGQLESGMTIQQNAMKEAYEELGLEVELTSVLGDFFGSTRYFIGKRIDGSPVDAGWETEAVRLVKNLDNTLDGSFFTNGLKDEQVIEALLTTIAGDKTLEDLLGITEEGGEAGEAAPEAQGVASTELDTAGGVDLGATIVSQTPEQRSKVLTAADVLATPLGAAAEGSSGGQFYEGSDGIRRYVKMYKRYENGKPTDEPDYSKAIGEHISNAVYQELGIAAPSSNLIVGENGELGFASEQVGQGKFTPTTMFDVIEGNSGIIPAKFAKQILNGFVADVFLANWDVVGSGVATPWDNVVLAPDGTLVRIDQGGALFARGMSANGDKPEAALNTLGEWNNFSNGKNPQYSQLFKATNLDDWGESLTNQFAAFAAFKSKYDAEGWDAFYDSVVGQSDAIPAEMKSKFAELLKKRADLVEAKGKELGFWPEATPPSDGGTTPESEAAGAVPPSEGEAAGIGGVEFDTMSPSNTSIWKSTAPTVLADLHSKVGFESLKYMKDTDGEDLRSDLLTVLNEVSEDIPGDVDVLQTLVDNGADVGAYSDLVEATAGKLLTMAELVARWTTEFHTPFTQQDMVQNTQILSDLLMKSVRQALIDDVGISPDSIGVEKFEDIAQKYQDAISEASARMQELVAPYLVAGASEKGQVGVAAEAPSGAPAGAEFTGITSYLADVAASTLDNFVDANMYDTSTKVDGTVVDVHSAMESLNIPDSMMSEFVANVRNTTDKLIQEASDKLDNGGSPGAVVKQFQADFISQVMSKFVASEGPSALLGADWNSTPETMAALQHISDTYANGAAHALSSLLKDHPNVGEDQVVALQTLTDGFMSFFSQPAVVQDNLNSNIGTTPTEASVASVKPVMPVFSEVAAGLDQRIEDAIAASLSKVKGLNDPSNMDKQKAVVSEFAKKLVDYTNNVAESLANEEENLVYFQGKDTATYSLFDAFLNSDINVPKMEQALQDMGIAKDDPHFEDILNGLEAIFLDGTLESINTIDAYVKSLQHYHARLAAFDLNKNFLENAIIDPDSSTPSLSTLQLAQAARKFVDKTLASIPSLVQGLNTPKNILQGVGMTLMEPNIGDLWVAISEPLQVAASNTFSASTMSGMPPLSEDTIRQTFDAARKKVLGGVEEALAQAGLTAGYLGEENAASLVKLVSDAMTKLEQHLIGNTMAAIKKVTEKNPTPSKVDWNAWVAMGNSFMDNMYSGGGTFSDGEHTVPIDVIKVLELSPHPNAVGSFKAEVNDKVTKLTEVANELMFKMASGEMTYPEVHQALMLTAVDAAFGLVTAFGGGDIGGDAVWLMNKFNGPGPALNSFIMDGIHAPFMELAKSISASLMGMENFKKTFGYYPSGDTVAPKILNAFELSAMGINADSSLMTEPTPNLSVPFATPSGTAVQAGGNVAGAVFDVKFAGGSLLNPLTTDSDVPTQQALYEAAIAGGILPSAGGGSAGGKLYEGADGVKRFVKNYKNPQQALDEVYANVMYQMVGVNAPISILMQKDGPGGNYSIATQWVDNAKQLKDVSLTKDLAMQVLDGVVADMVFANWDAVGLSMDNMVVDENGNIHRIDNGGSLRFRAQGAPKDMGQLLSGIGEWDTFFSNNPTYAKILAAAGVSSMEQLGDRLVGQYLSLKKMVESAEFSDKLAGAVWNGAPTNEALESHEALISLVSKRVELLGEKLKSVGLLTEDNQPHTMYPLTVNDIVETPFNQDIEVDLMTGVLKGAAKLASFSGPQDKTGAETVPVEQFEAAEDAMMAKLAEKAAGATSSDTYSLPIGTSKKLSTKAWGRLQSFVKRVQAANIPVVSSLESLVNGAGGSYGVQSVLGAARGKAGAATALFGPTGTNTTVGMGLFRSAHTIATTLASATDLELGKEGTLSKADFDALVLLSMDAVVAEQAHYLDSVNINNMVDKYKTNFNKEVANATSVQDVTDIVQKYTQTIKNDINFYQGVSAALAKLDYGKIDGGSDSVHNFNKVINALNAFCMGAFQYDAVQNKTMVDPDEYTAWAKATLMNIKNPHSSAVAALKHKLPVVVQQMFTGMSPVDLNDADAADIVLGGKTAAFKNVIGVMHDVLVKKVLQLGIHPIVSKFKQLGWKNLTTPFDAAIAMRHQAAQYNHYADLSADYTAPVDGSSTTSSNLRSALSKYQHNSSSVISWFSHAHEHGVDMKRYDALVQRVIDDKLPWLLSSTPKDIQEEVKSLARAARTAAPELKKFGEDSAQKLWEAIVSHASVFDVGNYQPAPVDFAFGRGTGVGQGMKLLMNAIESSGDPEDMAELFSVINRMGASHEMASAYTLKEIVPVLNNIIQRNKGNKKNLDTWTESVFGGTLNMASDTAWASFGKSGEKRCEILVRVPKGAPVLYTQSYDYGNGNTLYSGEQEVLIPPSAKLTIESVSYSAHDGGLRIFASLGTVPTTATGKKAKFRAFGPKAKSTVPALKKFLASNDPLSDANIDKPMRALVDLFPFMWAAHMNPRNAKAKVSWEKLRHGTDGNNGLVRAHPVTDSDSASGMSTFHTYAGGFGVLEREEGGKTKYYVYQDVNPSLLRDMRDGKPVDIDIFKKDDGSSGTFMQQYWNLDAALSGIEGFWATNFLVPWGFKRPGVEYKD